MSSGDEQITLVLPKDSKLTAIPFSSSGQLSCDPTSLKPVTWVCDIELVDTEDTVNQLIDSFGPQGFNNIADRNAFCNNNSSTGCQNWKEINSRLLKNYCQRIGTFPRGFHNGECPDYLSNPFNPLYPQSQGCSKMVVAEGICEEWVAANFENDGSPSYPNGSIQNYCDKVLTPDCACQSAQDSAIFQLVTAQGVGVGSTRCWWKPCTLDEGNYLVRRPDDRVTCPDSVCVTVANIFLQNDEIGKNVIINEVNACGKDNGGGGPWYKQWWFWIIVLTLVVILFAIIIYYTSKL